jgi:hypothetical protein
LLELEVVFHVVEEFLGGRLAFFLQKSLDGAFALDEGLADSKDLFLEDLGLEVNVLGVVIMLIELDSVEFPLFRHRVILLFELEQRALQEHVLVLGLVELVVPLFEQGVQSLDLVSVARELELETLVVLDKFEVGLEVRVGSAVGFFAVGI